MGHPKKTLAILNEFYHLNQFPNYKEKCTLVEKTGLKFLQVKGLFKNRRKRDKDSPLPMQQNKNLRYLIETRNA